MSLVEEILATLEKMPESEWREKAAFAINASSNLKWVPNSGPQEQAYFCEADELYFGGEAGGGKTALGVGLSVNSRDRSLLLRRFIDDARGLAEMAVEVVGHDKGMNRTLLQWRQPGPHIDFGGCQLETDKQRYKGQPHSLIFYDEAADFLESQVDFINVWNRSDNPKQHCRIIYASNPPLTADGLWLINKFAAWLDPKHPNPALPGELRFYLRRVDAEEEVHGPGPYDVDGEMVKATSRTFIRSRLEDNPDYARSDYKSRLHLLPEELRAAYREGKFETALSDRPMQVIPTAWIVAAQKRWTPKPPTGIPMTAMGIDMSGGGCFDDRTEILTDSGWKFFNSLMGTERVLSLNSDVSEWGEITEIHKYWHDGPLNVYNGIKVNFAITDNHNLLVLTNMKSTTFKLDRYDRLPGTFAIPRKNTWTGASPLSIEFDLTRQMPNGGHVSYESKFDFLDWAEFLGWFVSEGWVSLCGRDNVPRNIGIAQNPGHKMEKIKTILTKMGVKWRLKKNGREVHFTNTKIASFLRSECGHLAKNKRVPSHIKNGSPEVIERFLYSYHLGDGTTGKKGQKSYVTSSKILADDIQEMLCKIGRAGKISSRPGRLAGVAKIGDRPLGAGSQMYSIYECARHSSKTVVKSMVKRLHYTGYVYCVSTPLRTIMVRRNGCPMWSGNSDPMVIAPRHDWWFAKPIVFQGRELPMDAMGKYCCGIIVSHRRDKALVVLDMGGGYGSATYERLVENDIRVVPFKGSEDSAARTKDRQFGFMNKRAEAIWKFREALDPDQDGGSPIAIPPDQTLLADLASATFEVRSRGIWMKPKEQLVKELRRSTDKGDAVIMSWFAGGTALYGGTIKTRYDKPEVITKRTLRGGKPRWRRR